MNAHEKRNPNHPLRRAKDYVGDQRRRRWSKPERKYRLSYRRRPVATTLSTAAAIVASAAIAYGTAQVPSIFEGTEYAGSGWATCSAPITWTTDMDGVPDILRPQVRQEVSAAFILWGNGSGLAFLDGGEASTTHNDSESSVATVAEINRNIAITFLSNNESTMLSKEVVGFASPSMVFADKKEIVGGYAAFEIEYIIRANQKERLNLFIHEIGHALGLGHSNDKDNVMYSVLDKDPSLGSGDIKGLQAIIKPCDSQ